MLQVGDLVPDFTLRTGSRDGPGEFTLSKELGPGDLVLSFFPIAFTRTCTVQMCETRDALEDLRDLDAKIFGFSVDPHQVNAAYARQESLNFPIVSDPNFEVVERIWETTTVSGIRRRAKRGFLVVGPDGRVKARHVDENPSQWVGVGAIRAAIR